MPFNNRILVIDDDMDIIKVFKLILAREQQTRSGKVQKLFSEILGQENEKPSEQPQFTLENASQGEEGFELVKKAAAQKNPFALAFIDVRMPPGWDGIKTAKEIRAFDPDMQLVLVTAYADASLAEIREKVGSTSNLLYIKKPFDDEEIMQMADSLTMRWNLERKVRDSMAILGEVISSLDGLDFCQYDNELRPSLERILDLIRVFLDADAIFLANVDGKNTRLHFGVGEIPQDIRGNRELLLLVDRAMSGHKNTTVWRKNDFIVVPVILGKSKNILVGINPGREIEGADNLLRVLACNAFQIFDVSCRLSQLHHEVLELKQRKSDLLERLQVRLSQKDRIPLGHEIQVSQ